VAHRLTVLRALGVAALTAALALGLRAADPALLGEPVRAGWLVASGLGAIPPAAGESLVPPYVPPGLAWPPAVILSRVAPAPGLWLGLAPAGEAAPRLWIGTGEAPYPDALGGALGCLGGAPEPRCPPGWRRLSGRRPAGGTLHVLAALPPAELAGVLRGLEHQVR
jgi:hypothetical protein